MSSLVVDLPGRLVQSGKYQGMKRPADYFARTNIFQSWYKPTSAEHKSQEKAISKWLSGLNPEHALELGPGLGRITQLVASKYPETALTLVDVNKTSFRFNGAHFMIHEENGKIEREKLHGHNY